MLFYNYTIISFSVPSYLALNHNGWQESPCRPGLPQETFSPHVNNYLNYNNSPSFFNYRGGKQIIAIVPGHTVLVDGTGEEDFNHLQQEIFHPIMQILGIPLPCAQDSQGKGSIIQTIFQSKIKKVNSHWERSTGET